MLARLLFFSRVALRRGRRVCVYIARQSLPSDRVIRLHSLPKLAFTTYARAFAFFSRVALRRGRRVCLFVCLFVCVCTSLDKAPLRVALYVCIHHTRSRVCFFYARCSSQWSVCVWIARQAFLRSIRLHSLPTLALATYARARNFAWHFARTCNFRSRSVPTRLC